jgi:hypothetical protein
VVSKVEEQSMEHLKMKFRIDPRRYYIQPTARGIIVQELAIILRMASEAFLQNLEAGDLIPLPGANSWAKYQGRALFRGSFNHVNPMPSFLLADGSEMIIEILRDKGVHS